MTIPTTTEGILLLAIAVMILIMLVQNILVAKKVTKVHEELQESIDEIGDAVAVVDDDLCVVKRQLADRRIIVQEVE